jgi:cytosine/adenosine deaminase-related metal-dependent hydrolase
MDGTTINDNEDMWQEMRLALRLHRGPRMSDPAPTPADIFYLSTFGGAKLLRADHQRGMLAPGYHADVVLLNIDQITWPWVAPEADPLAVVLYRAAVGDVDTVLIGGEIVVEAGRVTTIDEAAIGQELADELKAIDYPTDRATMVAALMPYLEQYYAQWELESLTPYISYNSRL